MRDRLRHGRLQAYTVIELIIVVLVIGVLAAAATPAFLDSLLFHRVESAAGRVKTDLEYLRQTARLTSRTQSMTFTGLPASAQYEVDVPAGGTPMRDLNFRTDPYVVELWKPPFEISFVGLTELVGDQDTISFDGYGRPVSKAKITLRIKDHERSVVLTDTGEARIE
jgi:prepilin-type N-terminal cleavage/methylation domain-containing protein